MENISEEEIKKLKIDLNETYNSLNFEEIDNDGSILYLLCGTDSEDKEFYAYMAIKPSLFREFLEKQALEESFIATKYGVILESGFGNLPPKEIQDEMKEKYGFDNKYEDKIKELLTATN